MNLCFRRLHCTFIHQLISSCHFIWHHWGKCKQFNYWYSCHGNSSKDNISLLLFMHWNNQHWYIPKYLLCTEHQADTGDHEACCAHLGPTHSLYLYQNPILILRKSDIKIQIWTFDSPIPSPQHTASFAAAKKKQRTEAIRFSFV